MFTRDTLKQLHELTDKVNHAKEVASEQLRTAQDRFKDRKHKFERDGKNIEVTEKVLWDEVFYLGPGSQAGRILVKEHPQVFEAYAQQETAAEALKKFCIVELGVDYTALSLSDYLKLTETLVELMLAERGLPTKSPLSK